MKEIEVKKRLMDIIASSSEYNKDELVNIGKENNNIFIHKDNLDEYYKLLNVLYSSESLTNQEIRESEILYSKIIPFNLGKKIFNESFRKKTSNALVSIVNNIKETFEEFKNDNLFKKIDDEELLAEVKGQEIILKEENKHVGNEKNIRYIYMGMSARELPLSEVVALRPDVNNINQLVNEILEGKGRQYQYTENDETFMSVVNENILYDNNEDLIISRIYVVEKDKCKVINSVKNLDSLSNIVYDVTNKSGVGLPIARLSAIDLDRAIVNKNVNNEERGSIIQK